MEPIRIVRIANSVLGKTLSVVTAFLIRCFWVGRINKISNIPAIPCILISNHESYLDFLLIGYALRNKAKIKFSFWAKTKVVNHLIWRIYSNIFNSIEVNGNLRKLNEISQQAINRGEYICIFPEGKRTRNGDLQHFWKGYLRLASSIGIEIIPVFLENTYIAWPSHRLLPIFKRCHVTFHPSIKISKDLTEEEIDKINSTIMHKYKEFRENSLRQ